MGRGEMADAEMSLKLLAALEGVVNLLSFEWEYKPPLWLLGGSCGLLLHGVPLGAMPHDIDLYADLGAAERLHSALHRYAIDEPTEDRSRGCFSLLSHYRIGEMSVELVCGFQICSGRSCYSVETERLLQHAPVGAYSGIGLLRLMPLAHELVFNVLRDRKDRYEAIAAVMNQDMLRHSPLLHSLIGHNIWEASHVRTLERLIGGPRANV
jgi:hypothetical protein